MLALYERLRAGNDSVRLIETHISFVLLTGEHAYKIKKALRLEFLDFSTLASRLRFCEEELRLNRRLAPALYLDIVPITGPANAPMFAGRGAILDYAVRMREFVQEGLLGSVLERGQLMPQHIDALAAQVAAFHASASAAPSDSTHGAPDRVLDPALANFTEIESFASEPSDRAVLHQLQTWTREEYHAIREALERRRRGGAIRECHGDLHLGNIALVDGEVTIFDCIEFNESMRWIDTMSEIAFTVMDLEHRDRGDLAYRFLNAYCERSGDYSGASVLRFYLVYRCMVRAKIACLRASQLPDAGKRGGLHEEFAAYLRLALAYARGACPTVALMHGPSGTGKTTLSQLLLERARALRVRTDVERKRLAGLSAAARTGSALGGDLYAPDATRRTYDHVLACADAAVQGGWPMIVDGAFLQTWQRDAFRELAARRGSPFVIVDCIASEAALKSRIAARARAGTDASEADLAVLAHQLRTAQALSCDELRYTVVHDAEVSFTRSSSAVRVSAERIRSRSAPPGPPRWTPPGDTVLGSKVARLSLPRTYPDGTGIVEPVETHLSWVFLTEEYAFKLKKPAHDEFVDLRTVDARRRNCLEELRVNRRFSSGVYLDLVALNRSPSADISLDGKADAEPIDWLLRMRRLPADRMLDRLIVAGRLEPSALTSVVRRLCRVYARSSAALSAEAYASRLRETMRLNQRELGRSEYGLPVEALNRVTDRQMRFVQQDSCFDARVRAARVVEGHGDLRPEHVCLEPVPQIIDSLEFSRELRTLDAVDELGFLALECERLGAPQARGVIFDSYRSITGDAAPDALIHFYQSLRALVRARLAIRHLLDPDMRDSHRWPIQARRYLELALSHVERCD